MPAISQFRSSSDFITIANRKRGDWLRVNNQGQLQTVTTWLGKKVFLIRNYFLNNIEIIRLSGKLEAICKQLEAAMTLLSAVRHHPQNPETDFPTFSENVSEFITANQIIQTMQNSLNGMKENVITPSRLQSLTTALRTQLVPFVKQMTAHIQARKDEQFDFTAQDATQNASLSKQLLQYQKMADRLRSLGSDDLLFPLSQAITAKVEFTKRKLFEKQSQLVSTIETSIPFYAYHEKIQHGLRCIRELKERLQNVDSRLYNMPSLVQLEKAYKEPELTEAHKALETGQSPKVMMEGINGTYLMVDRLGMACGVFKPAEQETGSVGNPKGYTNASTVGTFGIRSGTSYLRERVAYLLDKDHLANVPYTTITIFTHKVFNNELSPAKPLKGSFQVFAKGCRHLVDVIPKTFKETILTGSSWTGFVKSFFLNISSKISVEQIHAMAVFDIRLLNGDRHLKNALVDHSLKLYPIDHGLILPPQAKLLKFEWMQLPQAKVPFSEDMLDYIEDLNEEADAAIAKAHKIEKEAIERMRIAYKVLKMCARAGMTAYEIGDLMHGNRVISYFESHLCQQIITNRQPPEQVIKQSIASYIKNKRNRPDTR